MSSTARQVRSVRSAAIKRRAGAGERIQHEAADGRARANQLFQQRDRLGGGVVIGLRNRAREAQYIALLGTAIPDAGPADGGFDDRLPGAAPPPAQAGIDLVPHQDVEEFEVGADGEHRLRQHRLRTTASREPIQHAAFAHSGLDRGQRAREEAVKSLRLIIGDLAFPAALLRLGGLIADPVRRIGQDEIYWLVFAQPREGTGLQAVPAVEPVSAQSPDLARPSRAWAPVPARPVSPPRPPGKEGSRGSGACCAFQVCEDLVHLREAEAG